MALYNLKENIQCYIKRLFFSRGIELSVEELPLFSFKQDEVVYNLNTTNNTIKPPKGFFRICFRHLPYIEYVNCLSGFYDSVPESQRPKRGFDFFIKKGLRDWRLNGNRYNYQTYNVCTSISEELVAKMLGLEHLLTKTFFCRIEIDGGEELVGTMSSVAEGVDVRALKDNYQHIFTADLAKELTNLNILDAICYEKDHRPGNYHIVLNEEGKAISICSFDNDSPWSFSPFGGATFKTYAGASELIKRSVINRPLIDSGVSERLLKISKRDVQDCLGLYLGKNQVNVCWKRVSDIQRAIERTRFQYEEWSSEVLNQELSGEYGKTYYAVLWDLCTDIKNGIK